MQPDPIRQGPQLTEALSGDWLTEQHIDRPLIVFVHGFTANGDYFRRMAKFLAGSGFSAAVFDYDSYVGIDTAGTQLAELLQPYIGAIRDRGLVLIAHSMGGLVARYFLQNAAGPELSPLIRGLCTLGTPHGGTLQDMAYWDFLVRWSESVGSLMPNLRLPMCRSAQQLVGSDADRFIPQLNNSRTALLAAIPVLTISGGQRFLELGKSGVFNSLSSRQLQKLLGDQPNDGLVTEFSAGLHHHVGKLHPQYEHWTGYSHWGQTNHTQLVNNQQVAQYVLDWCRRLTVVSQPVTGS